MKSLLKRVIPTPIQIVLINALERVLIITESFADAMRHDRWAAPTDGGFSKRTSGRALECQVTKDYHRVEKGLSLRAPKTTFGIEVQKRLELGIKLANPADAYVSSAEGSLAAIRQWNATGTIDPDIAPRRENFPQTALAYEDTSTASDLFRTRRSVRNFDESRSIPVSLMDTAVDLAGNTPSVCNRQPWRVTFVNDPVSVAKVLNLQNGNAGFAASVPAVAVITVDCRLFAGSGERNQRWVDGGLFAMSLVYALHSMKVQTCMLNWAMSNASSRAMRKTLDLAPYQDIVALVAIGYGPESYRVARSPRRPSNDVLTHKKL